MGTLDAFIEAPTEYLDPADLMAVIEAEERGGNGDGPALTVAEICGDCQYRKDCVGDTTIERLMCPIVRRNNGRVRR